MSYYEFLTHLTLLRRAYLKATPHLPRRSKYLKVGRELMEGSITQLRALHLRARLQRLYQEKQLTWPE